MRLLHVLRIGSTAVVCRRLSVEVRTVVWLRRSVDSARREWQRLEQIKQELKLYLIVENNV